MSEPRSKADKEAGRLSETTKSYVHEWLIEQQFGVKKQIETKEMKKGIEMEQEAIDLLAEHHKEFYIKNETNLSNHVMTGTPDIITKDLIIDIKCPWDCFNMPYYDDKLNTLYYWQMQGYMYLTGKSNAIVAYCLMNTPLELAYSELDNMDWSEFPTSKRIVEFNVERDNEAIQNIETRVEQIRIYLSEIK